MLKPCSRSWSEPFIDSDRPTNVSGPMNAATVAGALVVEVGVTGAEPADQRRDTCLVLLREPDPELEPERLRDLVAEERADAAAVDVSHHFPEQVAVGHRVVAVRGAGVPQWLLLLERPDHRVPCEHVGRRELGVERRQSCLVAQQVAHRDPFLARLRELGPVARDRKVDVELAALGEQAHARRVAPFVLEKTSCRVSVP